MSSGLRERLSARSLQVDARASSRLSAELLDAIAEALHARDTALTYPG